MKKRGQLTLFVFIAIVIVVAIVSYYLLHAESFDSGVSSEAKVVYDAVTFCVEDATAQALLDIGANGGYYRLPQEVNELYLPYYVYEGESYIATLDTVTYELEAYAADLVTLCSKQSFFALSGYDIVSGEISVDARINSDDTVSFEVKYPLKVTRGEQTYLLERPYTVTYHARLYTMYNFIEDIVEQHKKEPRAFCVNCIANAAIEHELFIEMWDTAPYEVVFFVSDFDSVINNESLTYLFAIKYVEGDYDPFASV